MRLGNIGLNKLVSLVCDFSVFGDSGATHIFKRQKRNFTFPKHLEHKTPLNQVSLDH